MSSLELLIQNASPSLSPVEPRLSATLQTLAGPLAGDLLGMLRQRNGFYALEGALHVFPSEGSPTEMGLDRWNEESLWRGEYQDSTEGCLFFAEDIFGCQFCIKDGSVSTFDPETGALESLAKTLEDWAAAVLGDHNMLTGYPLAHAWQEAHGPLPSGKRLLPKVPFVAQGEFALDNLYLGDAVEGMRYRAFLANQIKDLPDGAQIQFVIRE